MILTGRLGVRFGWFGKLILQVEAEELFYPPGSSHVVVWKDATINQLIRVIEMQKACHCDAAEQEGAKEKS